MLDGLQDPWYNKSTALTVASTDQAYLLDYGFGGSITNLTVVGSTITIVGPTLVAGTMLSLSLVVKNSGTIYRQCLARVTTGGTTSTATILSYGASGQFVNFNNTIYSLSCNVITSYSSTTIDVSGIYFKDFLKIYDNNFTGTTGQQTRVFDEYKDAKTFGDLSANPIISNIGWHQRGDTIELFVPTLANPLGTVAGEYRGKPAIYSDTTMNNIIDIPPEQNQMLVDEVTASYLIDRGKVVPPDLASRQVLYQKQYEAAEANRAKSMEVKNK